MASKTKSPRRVAAAKLEFQLTELECAVLGVIWRRGPCTAYVVQKNFAPVSAGWSASPGSIYPLMGRLARCGLISVAETTRRGGRGKRYVLTAKGLSHLREWVANIPDWGGLPPAEAIRTRSFYLDTLTYKERLAFLERARQETKTALAVLQAGAATEPPQSYERLAQLGGIFHLQARLRWLRAFEEDMASS